jgi:hypothetical protein
VDGGADACISAAAANVAHGGVDVFIGWLGLFLEQRYCSEHLATLAITALGHLVVNPGLLDSMQLALVGQAFDGDDLLSRSARDRVRTRAYRLAIEQDGARAALGHATSKFGTFDVKFVAQRPQQGHFGFDIQRVVFAVDTYFHVHSLRVESFAINYVVIYCL